MSTEVEPGDWSSIDPWWSEYTQAWPVVRDPTSVQVLDAPGVANCWNELNSWWEAYIDSVASVSSAAPTCALPTEQLADSWEALDPWWEEYIETGHETAVEIADLLERSNEKWRQSAAPFATDPLASPLTNDQGPLLPSNEEGWSDWLARLLRPAAALVSELFDVEVDTPPKEVIREDHLAKQEGGSRRPDVLVLYTRGGISIEVKIDDPHYGKTKETAGLIERDYPRHEWTHTLLLPKRHIEKLRSNVELPVRAVSDEGHQIEWENPGPVSVIYWGDVAAAIRTLLRRGEVVNDHWAANAYLFCAAVEQRILKYQPQPAIEGMANPGSVVDTIRPFTFADALGEQLTYLRARREV